MEEKTIEYKGYTGTYKADDEEMLWYTGTCIIGKTTIIFDGPTPTAIEDDFKLAIDHYLETL